MYQFINHLKRNLHLYCSAVDAILCRDAGIHSSHFGHKNRFCSDFRSRIALAVLCHTPIGLCTAPLQLEQTLKSCARAPGKTFNYILNNSSHKTKSLKLFRHPNNNLKKTATFYVTNSE